MFRSAPIHSFRSPLAKLAALALVVSASLCVSSDASAQTPVEYGDIITEPGVYFLDGNQSGSGTDGIAIQSDDVLLLLGRFTLTGDGTHYGVLSVDNENVTVMGGRVTNFDYGVFFADGADSTVRDMRLDHNDHGLVAAAMIDSSFLRLRCDENFQNGVEVRDCPGSRFVSILAHDNHGNGIIFKDNAGLVGVETTSPTRVRLCWAAYNELDGIHVAVGNPEDLIELVSNQCVDNGRSGIHLFAADPVLVGPPPGPHNVLVKSNWCVFNQYGIRVDQGARENTLTNNIALANSESDMIDFNPEPPCANDWFQNFFLTKDGAGEDCIF